MKNSDDRFVLILLDLDNNKNMIVLVHKIMKSEENFSIPFLR